MGLFRGWDKGAAGSGPNSVTRLRDFGRTLGEVHSREEVVAAFFTLLIKESMADSVGLFIRSDDGKRMHVHLHGIPERSPQYIGVTDSPLLSEYADTTAWALDIHGERRAGESDLLFLRKRNAVVACPLLSYGRNQGVLKLDFLVKPEIGEAEKDLLELLAGQFTTRLDQLRYAETLRAQRIGAWFDHLILKLKECEDRQDLPKILSDSFYDMEAIDAELLPSWRLYMADHRGGWHHIDLRDTKFAHVNNETHYGTNSHLNHFLNSDALFNLYAKADLKAAKLQPFRDATACESLCLRTDIQSAQLGHAGMAQQPAIIELWSRREDFLRQHEAAFQRVAQQIGVTLKALPSPYHAGIVDQRFLFKTREITEQLLRIRKERVLKAFLMENALQLAPEAEVVTYGEIELAEGEPRIVIRHSQGVVMGRGGVHLIRNSGLWERVWESGETVVVNNQYDAGVPVITSSPIPKPQSALCVPIFDRHRTMKGMLSLSSSRTNGFPVATVALVEWVVQAFASRLIQLSEAQPPGDAMADTRSIGCIRQITELFGHFKTGLEDYQKVFVESVGIVAKSLEASSWFLVRREGKSFYSVIRADGCSPGYESYVDKLPFSPVRDLLEDDDDELMSGDIRRQPKYAKLLPLLREDQRACLAARLEVGRIVPRSSGETRLEDSNVVARYGLFLFHSQADHYQTHHRDLLQIALALIQELMKRHTLAEELRRVMPLSVSGAMAAQVAHEIRTPCLPLGGLVGTLRFLLEDENRLSAKLSDREFRGDLAGMLEVADRALARIDLNASHLMHLADIKNFPVEPVAVGQILEDVSRYEWYGEEWKPGRRRRPIRIRVDPDGLTPMPVVRFDKFRLSTILTNLIKNAFEAINGSTPKPEGGEIVIGVEWADEAVVGNDSPWWRRRCMPSEGDVDHYPLVVFVSDNGPGISRAVQERLFEPFFSTKARGTGLGCTICRMLMEKIGGLLEIESVVGSGTTFRLRFPRDHVVKRSEGHGH